MPIAPDNKRFKCKCCEKMISIPWDADQELYGWWTEDGKRCCTYTCTRKLEKGGPPLKGQKLLETMDRERRCRPITVPHKTGGKNLERKLESFRNLKVLMELRSVGVPPREAAARAGFVSLGAAQVARRVWSQSPDYLEWLSKNKEEE